MKASSYAYSKDFKGVLRPINRDSIDGTYLYRVAIAVNVREGASTAYRRVMYDEFTAYEQEQVLADGGKASDNDFPKGMVLTVYKVKGDWLKISSTENKWVE